MHFFLLLTRYEFPAKCGGFLIKQIIMIWHWWQRQLQSERIREIDERARIMASGIW